MVKTHSSLEGEGKKASYVALQKTSHVLFLRIAFVDYFSGERILQLCHRQAGRFGLNVGAGCVRPGTETLWQRSDSFLDWRGRNGKEGLAFESWHL